MQKYLLILIFSFSCNSIDSGIELNEIKLGSKDLVKDKVMLVIDEYYNFNTKHIKDGRNYIIIAKSINKRNGNTREVDWEEIDKLIIFFEDKYEIELKPFGGIKKAPPGNFKLEAHTEYIPDGYKAVKEGVEYRINGAAATMWAENLDKFPSYYLVITDLELEKIHANE